MLFYPTTKQLLGVCFNPSAFIGSNAIAEIDDKVDEALYQLALDFNGEDFCDRIEAACPSIDMDDYLDGAIANIIDYMEDTECPIVSPFPQPWEFIHPQ